LGARQRGIGRTLVCFSLISPGKVDNRRRECFLGYVTQIPLDNGFAIAVNMCVLEISFPDALYAQSRLWGSFCIG
jgi:hypothetical protein